jgi:hypothetical protein
MYGLVFSGDTLPKRIENYRAVVYLLDGGYNREISINFKNLYYRSVGKYEITEFAEYMSYFGFPSEKELRQLIKLSKCDFKTFVYLVEGRYWQVLINIRNEIMSEKLKKLLEGLNRRGRYSVIVGETSNIPFINIESFLIDHQLSNVDVCGNFKRIFLLDPYIESMVLIDGNYLVNKIDRNEKITPGVPVFISKINKGLYLPNVINPALNHVYMVDELAEGTVTVKDYLVFGH